MGDQSDASPVAVELKGHYGHLRPLNEERDAAVLYRLSHDEDVDPTWMEMKVGPFADEATFMAHVADLVHDPKRAFFAVADNGDLSLVGSV